MTTEVGAKFVLDDHASEALEHIKGGVEQVSEKVSEVQHELGGMLRQAIATAVGFQFDRGVESLKELGAEAIHSALVVAGEEKALAGLLAMSDKTGKSIIDLKDDAKELRDNLEGMAVDMGVSTSTVIDSFEMVASRSNKSADQVKELVGQMAMAGKVVPGGADAIAAAFRDLETGIVRPKNAIVSLIKMTGTAGGSQKQIAQGLSAMMQQGPAGMEKAFKLAEEAIGKMSAKAKDIPLGFGAVTQSLSDMREQLFAAMGAPMVKALTEPLNRLRQYFMAHREEFEKLAQSMGVKVGEWMTEAAKKIEDGFRYLRDHAEEIKKAIGEGVSMAKQVVEFVLAHKTELAMAFGLKAVAPMVGGAVRGAMGFGSALAGVGNVGGAAAGMAGGLGASMAAAATAGLALLAFAAAIGAVGAAVYQAHKLMEEIPDKQQDTDARLEALKKDALNGELAHARKMRDAIVTVSPKYAVMTNALLEQAAANEKANRSFAAQVDQHTTLPDAGDAAAISQLFGQASAAGNSAQMDYAARIVAGSDEIRSEILKAGIGVDQAGADFIEHMRKFSTDAGLEAANSFAQSLNKSVGAYFKGKDAAKPEAPIMNFSGPITIQQDFKDQDPDRIAVVFRRDLVRHASARIRANTHSGLGF